MFSTNDTIVAIATPPGRGGIGVVRLSGPDAHAITLRLVTHNGSLRPRRATLTRIACTTDAAAEPIDQVVVTSFPRPHSYTGDDVVEVSAHGSPVILRAIVEAAIDRGARLAEPGEFTLRAFLNGRIDLMQAEAVADLIDAVTPLQARLEASVDFPDEGYHFVEPGALGRAIDDLAGRTAALLAGARRGQLIRDGLQIAIVGRPNVGKSSLFNALAGAARAIVTDVPGTTRDLVTEVVDLDGLRVTLVDTAGLRETSERVESEGVERARRAAAVADLVLIVVDEDEAELVGTKHLVVQNKADLERPSRGVRVSAVTGAGLDDLRRAIIAALDVEPVRDRPALTNVRHIALVERAHVALTRAAGAARRSMPEEFVLADLQDARAALEEISGRRASEALLEHIFARFCIGK